MSHRICLDKVNPKHSFTALIHGLTNMHRMEKQPKTVPFEQVLSRDLQWRF